MTLTSEEQDFLSFHEGILQAIDDCPENFTDEEVKINFDHFYGEVCSWRDRYDTEVMSLFWAVGVGYDGFIPGMNPSFIGLYKELMTYAKDPYQEVNYLEG